MSDKAIIPIIEDMNENQLRAYAYMLEERLLALVEFRKTKPLEKIGVQRHILANIPSRPMNVLRRAEREFYLQKSLRMVSEKVGWWQEQVITYLETWFRKADLTIPAENLKRSGTSTRYMWLGFLDDYCKQFMHDGEDGVPQEWLPSLGAFTTFVVAYTKLRKDKGVSLYTLDNFGHPIDSCQCILGLFPEQSLIRKMGNSSSSSPSLEYPYYKAD